MPLAIFVYGWAKVRINVDAYTTWEWLASVLDSMLGCGVNICLKDPVSRQVVAFDPHLPEPQYKVSKIRQ